mgnify:FL=1
MTVASINVRVERNLKESAETVFKELGMSMTSAINIFLRQTVRDQGLPFQPVLTHINKETIDAIEEGRKLASDPNTKKYSSMDELSKAFDEI